MARPLVLCDFDNTISTSDVTDTLLQRFGMPGHEELENDWVAGKIGSKECMSGQIGLLNTSFDELNDCLNEITIDPHFPQFVKTLQKYNIDLRIVSDGLDYAIDVEVPDDNIINRMSGRRACVACGGTYHIKFNPTKKEGICDACGGELILRDDDKPETVKQRLTVYHDQTQPLIDYYTKEGILKEVDGTLDLQAVFAEIVKILEK